MIQQVNKELHEIKIKYEYNVVSYSFEPENIQEEVNKTEKQLR